MMLLVMAGIETNPGPRGQSFRLEVFNAGGATKKAAGIHGIIHDNKLDAFALCATVSVTTHDAVNGGLEPTGFKISHQHRTIVPVGPKKVGGLAFIVREDVIVTTHPMKSINSPTMFEKQLLNVRVANFVSVIANIYRPPSSSEKQFIYEFSEFLAALIQSGDRLIVCGDFNLPVVQTGLVDDRLLAVLEQLGTVQQVRDITHVGRKKDGKQITRDDILDLVITRTLLQCYRVIVSSIRITYPTTVLSFVK